MANQFVHYGVFGRAPKKGSRAFECASGMLAEASRVPGATKHLGAKAKPAKLIYGVMPIELEAEVGQLADNAVDLCGRRIRSDASILVSGVISYPIAIDMIGDDKAALAELEAWVYAVRDWLKKMHKGKLRSIVVHMDEPYMHVHFFNLPTMREDGTLDWADAHPGMEKKRFSWLLGETPIIQNRCYRAAMQLAQDDFHANVSVNFGHDRFGPRRQRLGRDEARLHQGIEEDRRAAQAALDEERRVALAEIDRRKKAVEMYEDHVRLKVAQILKEVDRYMASLCIRMSPVERSLALGRLAKLQDKLLELVSAPLPVQDHEVFATPSGL